MNTPPFLLAAACALWAAQTGHWLVAAAAACAVEAWRTVPLRWRLTQGHFYRLSDFCSVLILAVAGYLYFTFGNPRALLLLFQWLPVALLPLALAQAWGDQPRIGVAAFVWNLRKDPAAERYAVNLGFPYFGVWLVAASAANVRSAVFYAALVALAGWALWGARPRRYAPAVWVALLAAAGGAGYGAHHGLARLQAWIEESVPEWLSASGERTDPYSSRTDLGHIGELKLDDAIVLRVRPDGPLVTPLLLHRASYNGYFATTWTARNAPLVTRLTDGTGNWMLDSAVPATPRVKIFDYAPRGNPVLALPPATVAVLGLPAPEIKRNRLGTIQAELPPGYFSYTAVVGARAEIDPAPDAEDLRLPRSEQPLLTGLAHELGLKGMGPERAVAAVRQFFARDFTYSTYRPRAERGPSVLAEFLLTRRTGHCEYFATATVLLLRAAGVPARYATGFSVQEYSRLENAYIVRERHAHAWARAWVNGRWIEVDTTPPIWAGVEAREASWWSPVADLVSWTRFRVWALAAGARSAENRAAFWSGVAALLAAWLGWRLYRQRRLLVVAGQGRRAARGAAAVNGADSEFFLVERALARAGFPREPAETVMAWLGRIGSLLPERTDGASLIELARLHYRYRFDPQGLVPADRERLRATAERWLARHAARSA